MTVVAGNSHGMLNVGSLLNGSLKEKLAYLPAPAICLCNGPIVCLCIARNLCIASCSSQSHQVTDKCQLFPCCVLGWCRLPADPRHRGCAGIEQPVWLLQMQQGCKEAAAEHDSKHGHKCHDQCHDGAAASGLCKGMSAAAVIECGC